MSAYSSRRYTSFRLLCAALALLAPAALVGCSHKDDQPSAPGYYNGPMTKANKMNDKGSTKGQ